MFLTRRDTLYNVLFPIWMLWLFPAAWLIVLPANFGIDFLVVALTLRALHKADVLRSTLRVIPRVFLMGFVADLIGTALMFLPSLPNFPGDFGRWWYDSFANPVCYHPFRSIYALLYVTVCTACSGLCIYWFNRAFCLKKAGLDERQKHRAALSVAVFTAPYLFFFPSIWLY